MQCIQCKRLFLNENRVASISGSIMGDEHTDSYFLCPVCGVYTVVSWWDNFTGIESESLSGPQSKQEGDNYWVFISNQLPEEVTRRRSFHIAISQLLSKLRKRSPFFESRSILFYGLLIDCLFCHIDYVYWGWQPKYYGHDLLM